MTKKVGRLAADPFRHILYAACFAVSNMGQPREPLVQHVARLREPSPHRQSPMTLANAVMVLAHDYMEDDEAVDAFMDEARSWHRQLDKKSYAEIHKSWPWVGELWDKTEPVKAE